MIGSMARGRFRGDDDQAEHRADRHRCRGQCRSLHDGPLVASHTPHLPTVDRTADDPFAGEQRIHVRNQIGFRPGEAAGLVALAYLAAETGDSAVALHHLDEARSVAESCGAKAVLGWIEEARTNIRSWAAPGKVLVEAAWPVPGRPSATIVQSQSQSCSCWSRPASPSIRSDVAGIRMYMSRAISLGVP